LERKLRRLQVDVLLQDELNHPSLAWVNRRVRRQVSYPIATIIHHLRSSESRPEWQNRLYAWIERAYLQSVAGFVFNSCASRAAVAKLLGLDPQRFPYPHIVAPPAGNRFDPHITPDEIAARAHAPGPLRVLFTGNLIRRKGVHTLLEAVRRLPPQVCRVEIIGSLTADPAYTADLGRMAESPDLRERVELIGRLPDAALAERMRSAHLLAVPSSYEGFGIVYLEGMSFGLPAIGCNQGGAGEIITDGLNGFLIPPNDPPALAERLLAVAADRDHLTRLSLAARQRFEAHPTWEMSMAQVREYLLTLG
jgi:glycosyltransferase involved in cell wall biosynthesis